MWGPVGKSGVIVPDGPGSPTVLKLIDNSVYFSHEDIQVLFL